MRTILTAVILAACATGVQAQECVGSRCRVVVTGGAQAHADRLAATGGFFHDSRHGTAFEGIGRASTPAAAIAAACRPRSALRVIDTATAWCPVRKQWVAVVRYGR